MRKFKLINGNGQEFDLMRKDALLSEPSGLGFSNTVDAQRIGATFAVVSTEQDQPNPAGTMVFESYAQYEEFRTFVRVGGLTLCYMPISTWLYLPVALSIEKSEIEYASKRLLCAVDFSGTGYWHEKLSEARTQDSAGGKIYSYEYPFTYTSVRAGSVELDSGSMPSYCKIHIFGTVISPSWAVYVGNKKIHSGKVLKTIASGRKLVIDTNPSSMEISEYTANGEYVYNIYAQSDFSTERIFEIPAGKSRMVFSHDGTNAVTAFVEVKRRV